MNAGNTLERLAATVTAVRELMTRRLEAESLAGEARREIERALAELESMWKELQGQAALLAQENERYAEFFQYAPDACVITDASGGVREANQAALELLGAARPDLVGRPLSELLPDRDRLDARARAVGNDGELCWLIGPA